MRTLVKFSIALGLFAAFPALAAQRTVSTARYPLAPAGRLVVENVQGGIEVEAWDRAEVEVTGIKTALGPGSRLENVQIAVESTPRALTLRTVYWEESQTPVRVDYRLRVPRQVRLDRLRTVEGDITVRNIEGFVDARSLNGSIAAVDLTGSIVAHASHGDIAVSFRALPAGTAPLYLDTLKGNIGLVLPPRANVDLQLSTVAGKVEGPVVLVASAVPGDTTQHARLGRGGVVAHLRTVRGNIRLEEREDLL